ncbi:hypothetical protein M409DRAFT_58095 [Zasmidium cellare ATCC 36951]|uniref:Xylanolytic transcriptional activator regulatory domain-containing protein n=1 Tax=Zasmidium cellare ATCC 36951 TaxID=1080233 RepID=A0A6A6C767_ZASCE|nr:uncharacterized protein M409DRAFT_58095 [Zasmidium cellare ATCC 36951]KAF2162683.1 hypothetical protein M409DRAFT_58095 [Zasmidium cellare ATCC 36951]
MESAPATTAAQVCLTCKLRKKGCDKLLPCCLQCRYLPVAVTPPSPAPTDVVVVQRLGGGAWYPSPPSPRTFGSDFRSSSQTICDQVCQTIGEIGQHADVLAHCYFRGLHLWLPFLSRDTLHRSLVRFPAFGDADFSLLLLCVCLIGYIPASEAAFRLDELYQRAKAAAALLQLYPVASLNSIRAFTLLAIYEYCTQRVDDALTTLTVAIRMSYSIHLEEKGQRHPRVHDEPRTDVDVYQSEANNLWWTLVICERLLVLETSNPWQPLLTPLPSEVHSLPSSSATPPKVTSRASITSFDSVDGSGRAAQAAVLMDRVLNFVGNLDSNAAFLGQTVLTDLTYIDADIQSFLSLVLEQCHGVWGQFCCSVATAMK